MGISLWDSREHADAYNSGLANNLGNLYSRILTMCLKYFDGRLESTNSVDSSQWRTGLNLDELVVELRRHAVCAGELRAVERLRLAERERQLAQGQEALFGGGAGADAVVAGNLVVVVGEMVIVDRRAARGGQLSDHSDGVRAIGAVVRAEEPELVLDQVPAQVAAEVPAAVDVGHLRRGRRTIGRVTCPTGIPKKKSARLD